MSDLPTGRRAFLRQSAFAVGAVAAPMELLGNSVLPTYLRQEWQVFKTGTHYNALINAIRTMKANTNANDPSSWTYWVNIHQTRCPHGIAYFLGWHRGYLYHFEKRLRIVSGDSGLVLPYWDYYSNPNLPAEFADPASANPLYVERVNTNVKPALSMDPFSPFLINFQTGKSDAFEPSVETAPHNTLHNIVGGVMSDMQSPIDPIFWLHHANVDRLWVAWVSAAGGRKMPAKSTSYWAGNYVYTSALTLARTQTYDTRTNLAYYYQNEKMPTTLPALAAGESSVFAEGRGGARVQAPPAVGTFKLSNPRATGDGTFSVAGALQVGLDERSVSVQLPVSSEYGQAISKIAGGKPASVRGAAILFNTIHLVLDNVELTATGANGGYFYKVNMNLPAARDGSSAPRTLLIGTLGPFQVRAAQHHGNRARLRYRVTQWLRAVPVIDIGMVTVSFVRVNGERSPAGAVLHIGEVRMEVSAEDDAP
jgi:tyrosinase